MNEDGKGPPTPVLDASPGRSAPALEYSAQREPQDEIVDSPIGSLARWLSPLMWGFIGVICVGIVTSPFALLMPYFYGLPLALVSDVFVILAIARIVAVVRRNRAGAIVAVLEQAVRLNLPLIGFVSAAATGEPGELGKRLRGLATYLGQGMAVCDALRAAVPEMPERSLLLLASAERRGRLAPALASVRDELRPWIRRLPPASYSPSASPGSSASISFLYPVFLLLMIQFMLAGFMIFVLPKFREIFNDFKVSLPPLTESLMTSRDFLASTPLFALLQLLIVAVILFTLGRVIEQTLFLGRKPPLLGSWLSRLRWACPLTHKMDRDQGLADVCGLMADALRAGATVPAAIYETLSLPVNVVLHDRLAMWASLHTQGAPLGAAAEQAMLPRLMSSLLATTGPSAAPGDPTSNASGLSDALDFLQRYYRGQFSRIIVFLRGALEPACVLMLGFIVGTVVVALFYPLVVLINTVIAASPNAGGY